MPKPDIMQLLFALNNNVIECRRELAEIKRILKGFTPIEIEKEPILPEDTPEVMITEEVYEELCELLDEDEMDLMGVA
jgi:hypothetical protein